MKKFLITILAFVCVLFCISEIIIRTFQLVPDIPERYIDEYGIQKYKPNQSGYFTKAKAKWNVNNYGWLGTDGIKKDKTITIIGDSYIENIMNPIECHQGSILKNKFPDYEFFEAARAGISFIEAMEISKVLQLKINPKYQLIYLNENDFYESISEIRRYPDILQISVYNKKILHAKLKSPTSKKILYNVKTLYYLYMKYSTLMRKKNKEKISNNQSKREKNDSLILNELLSYCSENYDFKKIFFVLHPNTDDRVIDLIHTYNIKTIKLNSASDKPWNISSLNVHWTCYGHNQASKQVAANLKEFMK